MATNCGLNCSAMVARAIVWPLAATPRLKNASFKTLMFTNVLIKKKAMIVVRAHSFMNEVLFSVTSDKAPSRGLPMA